jgi:hypothetical protein
VKKKMILMMLLYLFTINILPDGEGSRVDGRTEEGQ